MLSLSGGVSLGFKSGARAFGLIQGLQPIKRIWFCFVSVFILCINLYLLCLFYLDIFNGISLSQHHEYYIISPIRIQPIRVLESRVPALPLLHWHVSTLLNTTVNYLWTSVKLKIDGYRKLPGFGLLSADWDLLPLLGNLQLDFLICLKWGSVTFF